MVGNGDSTTWLSLATRSGGNALDERHLVKGTRLGGVEEEEEEEEEEDQRSSGIVYARRSLSGAWCLNDGETKGRLVHSANPLSRSRSPRSVRLRLIRLHNLLH